MYMRGVCTAFSWSCGDLIYTYITHSTGGTDQEVEIQMYDVDNLSSPPSSAGSDTDLTSYDPLLDFTHQDGLDHNPGVPSAGAKMNKSVQKMQREITVNIIQQKPSLFCMRAAELILLFTKLPIEYIVRTVCML